MADIEARQAQAVREAASWRWPWWYVAATAALMVGISVAMDFDQDPAMFIVVYCCGASLLLIAVAGVYVLARMALGAAGAPLPSTLAGLLMAGAYAAGLPLAQQMTARR